MPEWLSDEELDAIARTFADECDVEKLLAQAGEANRLRAGLEELEEDLGESASAGCSYAAGRIRELLEGGE